MCGITGIYLWREEHRNELDKIYSMNDVLFHRGPDGEGYFRSDRIALGHRRLSIIDLSTSGDQPITSHDGNTTIVFNGEIYNYQQLRAKYKSLGYDFKTTSDTETILAAYHYYPDSFLQELEGMFAFALYDRRKDELLLSRDRIGEKPLFYTMNEKGVYFSSEIKSLYHSGTFNGELLYEGVGAFFNYLQIPAPLTIFKNVYKLEPGMILTFKRDKKCSFKRYWSVDGGSKLKFKNIDEAKSELDELLVDVVKKTIVSDVPIGLLLSGGVDSSLVLGLISKHTNTRIETFTVRANDPNIEDLEYDRALRVASRFKAKNHAFDFASSNFSDLKEAINQFDEPIGLLEVFYMYGILKQIKGKAKVILTGNGADEVFAGYKTYGTYRKIDRLMSAFQLPIRNLNSCITSIASSYNFFNKSNVLNQLFSHSFISSCNSETIKNLLGHNTSNFRYSTPLDAKLTMDLMVSCNHSLVGIPDVCGMANSIEMRSPFLNHRLIEFAFKLDSALKVNDSNNPLKNKYLIKEVATSYYPREEVYAPKYGYGYFIDTYKMMRGPWRKEIEDLIFSDKIKALNYFSSIGLRNLWNKFIDLKISMVEKIILARLVFFLIWYDEKTKINKVTY